jgi:hypothetical protein
MDGHVWTYFDIKLILFAKKNYILQKVLQLHKFNKAGTMKEK